MSADEPTFDASSFSRNRDRLLDHDVAAKFFAAVVQLARAAHLMSHDHFTVNGTLIKAMASLKSFRCKDEKPEDRGTPDGRSRTAACSGKLDPKSLTISAGAIGSAALRP